MTNMPFARGLIAMSLVAGSYQASAAAFDYAASIDMGEQPPMGERETFLSFMERRVKPAMDELATDGYAMCDSATVGEAYAASHSKVRGKVTRLGGITAVKGIVDRLNDRLDGSNVTLASLPGEIRAVAPGVSSYDLANFLGLACGGGVRVDFYENNFALNVHYDVTEERSGRSFGVSDSRAANDASDKDYLDDLQDYSQSQPENMPAFYTALFGSLLKTDGSGFADVSEDGRAVLTDFLAVYIAEQARNLMDGSVTPHWDAALLEVTLLASFHAGQDELALYYKNPATGAVSFTDQTLRQRPCAVPTSSKTARLSDYWQFSRNIADPANCKRSGINITKSEFRMLGAAITTHLRQNRPAVYQRVKAALGLTSNSTNLYYSLSKYLIGNSAPRRLSDARAAKISDAWVELLTTVTEDAAAISATLD